MIDNYEHKDSNLFYITENIMGPYEKSSEYKELHNNFNSLLEYCCCRSFSGCSALTCKCLQNSNGENYMAYMKNEVIKSKILKKVKQYPIFECNDSCTCSIDCDNRVVQKGPTDMLEIRNCEKGLGLFATGFIPAGMFICEYAGELITTSQARIRHQINKDKGMMNYIFCLREVSNSQPTITIIDPSVFGNIGRYLNHSCEPNCFVTPVRCGSPVPKLAIFAFVDIPPNEELTFDYGISDNVRENVNDRTKCLCNSKNCKGFMPYHGYL